MMIFKQMLPGQKLILARIETKQPPTRPVIGRSTHRPNPEPILIRFILWILVTLLNKSGRIRSAGDTFFGAIYTIRDSWGAAIRANWGALTLLTGVMLSLVIEALAAGYIQKMVGVA